MFDKNKFLQLLNNLSLSEGTDSEYSVKFLNFIKELSAKDLRVCIYELEVECQNDYTLAYNFVNHILSHKLVELFDSQFDGAVIFAARQAASRKQAQNAKNLLQKLLDARYPNLNITLPDISAIDDPMRFNKNPLVEARGAYSTVSLSTPDRNNNNMIYVLKYFSFIVNSTKYDFYSLEVAFRESIILKFLNLTPHQNIIQLYETYLASARILMKMEYATAGNLHDLIYTNQPLVHNFYMDFINQVLDGLIYIHSQNIVHRDIKPANIAIHLTAENKYVVKLIDFGGSKFIKDLSLEDDCVTTIFYASPESLSREHLESDKSDIYSVIHILFMMVKTFTAGHSFGDCSDDESISHINKNPDDIKYALKNLHEPTTRLPSLTKTITNQYTIDIMKKELLASPEDRSTAKMLKEKLNKL